MSTAIKTALAVALAACAVSFLSAQTPAPQPAGPGRGAAQGRGTSPSPRPGAGPADRPAVDPAAADRGRHVWATECITCHGAQARGTDRGPNLIRSALVMHDRYGSELGPFLKKGHPTQSGTGASLTDTQVVDLTHFLRQRMHDTLRGSPVFNAKNVLTGDAKAGAEYFNGDGTCSTCHSPTGNLAGIGARYEPVDLQQRMLFPIAGRGGRGAAPSSTVTVTVTPSTGEALSGVLVQLDDLHVILRDASGAVRVVRRAPRLKVVKSDPLQVHHELLDRITDKNMHDLVAYLESLK